MRNARILLYLLALQETGCQRRNYISRFRLVK